MTEQDAQQTMKPKMSRAKFGLYIVAFLLVVTGIAAALHIFRQPNQGVITTSPVASAEAATSYLTLQTDMWGIEYPAYYVVRDSSQTDKTLLDYRLLVAGLHGTSPSAQIGISVKNTPEGGVANDSSYRYYNNLPDTYQLKTKKLQSNTFFVFTSLADPYTQVAYTVQGKHLAIISHSSTSGATAELTQEFDHMLASYHWQQ